MKFNFKTVFICIIIILTFILLKQSNFKRLEYIQSPPITPPTKENNEITQENKQNTQETHKSENRKQQPINKENNTKKNFKIGILPMYIHIDKEITNIKLDHIEFDIIHQSHENKHDRFPQYNAYKSLFDYYIYLNETEYTYEQYKEDIVLSQSFFQHLGNDFFSKYDYIYVPHFGMKLNTNTLSKLYEFINESTQNYPNACYYQSYMNKKDRESIVFNSNGETYNPKIPSNYHRSYGGALLKPYFFHNLGEVERLFYYTGRFDVILQIYCEFEFNEIVVSSTNIVDLPNTNSFN